MTDSTSRDTHEEVTFPSMERRPSDPVKSVASPRESRAFDAHAMTTWHRSNERKGWLRATSATSIRVGAALTVMTLLATLIPFTAADAISNPVRGTKDPISHFYTHICTLITTGEVSKVFGAPVTKEVRQNGYPGSNSCSYVTSGGETSFQINGGTAASMKLNVPEDAFVNEPSVGHNAFCDDTKGLIGGGTVYVDVGIATAEGVTGPNNFEVAGETCSNAAKLAKDALAKIS